jgi:hypothetical protein
MNESEMARAIYTVRRRWERRGAEELERDRERDSDDKELFHRLLI